MAPPAADTEADREADMEVDLGADTGDLAAVLGADTEGPAADTEADSGLLLPAGLLPAPTHSKRLTTLKARRDLIFLARLWQWFSTVDTDRSGSINAGELERALINGDWTRTHCRLLIITQYSWLDHSV
jgi:hypothetical protein